MARALRNQQTPWIENLILGYDGQEESSDGGRLKAYVIGVGQMSQSQALSSEGLTVLLFLSDGALQLPAVLTASAWERLQEREDRESFTSLVNTTVWIRDYRLRFHVAPQQVRCRFFLSVGELDTTAAGPVRDNTPCCTSLPSVRQKISQTWRALQGLDLLDSQRSQLDLTELLGEWQHDCVQEVLGDVRERLLGAGSPQPSTSADTPLPGRLGAFTATGWDVDRVKYKREQRFIVPVRSLLLPEEDALRLHRKQTEDTETDPPPSETPQPPSDDAGSSAARERVSSPPVDQEDASTHMIDSHMTIIPHPWDMYLPPSVTSSCSDTSPVTTPTDTEHAPTTTTGSSPDHAGMLTSKQLPVLGQETTEHSYLAPYQSPPRSSGLPETLSAEAAVEEQRGKAQGSGDPPSWLFDTQMSLWAEESGAQTEGQNAGSVWRKTPTVHSDGRPFAYSYQVTGQNLQDFSGLRVSESLLHWAVKYLVPKARENPLNESVTSDRIKVTPL